MKIYINHYSINREPVLANIDTITVNKEVLWDGYILEEKAIDIKQIKNIIRGLELMGCPVKKIVIPGHCFMDLDTKFYHGFPEEVTDEIYNKFCKTWSQGGEVYIKGNRIYTKVGDQEIVLPKDIYSDYDDRTLRVEFHI